jgi:Fic family protein
MTYNWQQKDWPQFYYNLEVMEDLLMQFNERVAEMNGKLSVLDTSSKNEALADIMVSEAIKNAEIEGEFLSRKDVISSIKGNLGLVNTQQVTDKKAAGMAALVNYIHANFKEALSANQLFDWHKMLFPIADGFTPGLWRTHAEPMQVVSGAMGKEKVHYEAPPSVNVPQEMERFINWFNNTAPGGQDEVNNAAIRSAIVHLYFESIHPFEDGNGRIGRALAEKALSQGMRRPAMLSLSRAIEADKKAYYSALEKAQCSNEITGWLNYFLKVILAAQDDAEAVVDFTLRKARFFDRFKNELSERQLVAVRRMLEEGPRGFEGGMNTRKYIGITKTSKATATRDLHDLLQKGIFTVYGAGRNTSYQLTL